MIKEDILHVNKQDVQDFRDMLTTTPLLQYWEKELWPNDEIICSFVSGSMNTPWKDDETDLDIQIMTKNTYQLEPFYNGSFKDRHTHWWFVPYSFSWVITHHANQKGHLLFVGLYYWKYFTEDSFLYVHPKYAHAPQVILEYQEQVSQLGLFFYLLYRKSTFTDKICSIIKPDWILLDDYYTRHNLEKDDKFTNLILKTKRSRLNNEEYSWVSECVQETYNYYLGQIDIKRLYKLWMDTIYGFTNKMEVCEDVNI